MFRSTAPTIIPAFAALSLLLSGCGVLNPPPASTESKPEKTPAASSSTAARQTPSPTTATTSKETDAGAYVPASWDAPAQNPAAPSISDQATEETAKGLSSAISDWKISHNYAVTTGDSTAAREAINPERLKTFTDMYDTYDEVYQEGSWVVGGTMSLFSAPDSFTETTHPGVYSMHILYGRECGAWVLGDTASYECAEDSQDLQAKIFARYTGERWIIEDMVFRPA